ncbi:hypothetical protein [Methylobacterium sp. Leaf361]|uniref:hypothetical protein n=1 Tax=Methylobacterium sp. Leaf361 TaxID=1736352 RepID=UPI0012FF4571|nr:hypothetical protein [Methylobacterium sp. Leaf361]
MSDDPKPASPKLVPLREPEHVPVRVVNRAISIDWIGSQFDVVLGTTMIGVTPSGEPEEQMVIAARLRFDLEMARILHDRLTHAIGAVTPPPKEQVN